MWFIWFKRYGAISAGGGHFRFPLIKLYPKLRSHLTFLVVDNRPIVPELGGEGVFVLKGPYDPRVPPIVKFSQESESVRLTKIIFSKSTLKTL